GLEAAMTESIDAPLSLWEESFLPLELMENVRRATITDAAGREAPLGKAETLVVEAARPAPPDGVPGRLAASPGAGARLGAPPARRSSRSRSSGRRQRVCWAPCSRSSGRGRTTG